MEQSKSTTSSFLLAWAYLIQQNRLWKCTVVTYKAVLTFVVYFSTVYYLMQHILKPLCEGLKHFWLWWVIVYRDACRPSLCTSLPFHPRLMGWKQHIDHQLSPGASHVTTNIMSSELFWGSCNTKLTQVLNTVVIHHVYLFLFSLCGIFCKKCWVVNGCHMFTWRWLSKGQSEWS